MKTLADLRALPTDEYLEIMSAFFSEITLSDEQYSLIEEWEDAVCEMFLEQDSAI